MWFKAAAISVLVFYTISSVNCQTTLRDELKANLTRMVKFVIHPTAVASKEIVDFALSNGGSPKTISERIAYLGFIKDIARKLPVFMAKFITTTTRHDGSTVQQTDESAFDNAITTKAQEYSNRKKKLNANVESGNNTGTGSNIITGNALSNSRNNVNEPLQEPRSPIAPPGPAMTSNGGTISLLDVFRAAQYNQMLNRLNP